MLARPLVDARVVGEADIEGRRQLPATFFVHQEGEILCVIVAVHGGNIECAPQPGLLDRLRAKLHLQYAAQVLFISMHVGKIEVQMRQSAKRMNVQFAVAGAVEAPGHEVRATAFLQQMARTHSYAGGGGHQIVGILDAPKARGRPQRAIVADIELEEPMFEVGRQFELPGDDFVGGRVPADQCLGTGTACGTADIDDVLRNQPEFSTQRPAGIFDQGCHLQRRGGSTAIFLAQRGREFQCAHSPASDIDEALQGRDVGWPDTIARHVFVNQRVAELVGERVGNDAGQSAKGFRVERREAEARPCRGRQEKRRNLQARAQKRRFVFEFVDARPSGQRRNGTHRMAPEPNFDGANFGHDSPHHRESARWFACGEHAGVVALRHDRLSATRGGSACPASGPAFPVLPADSMREAER